MDHNAIDSWEKVWLKVKNTNAAFESHLGHHVSAKEADIQDHKKVAYSRMTDKSAQICT